MEKILESQITETPIPFDGWAAVFNPFTWRKRSEGRLRVHFCWGRIIAALLTAGLTGYLALAGVAFGIVRYQQHVIAVTYIDFVTPTHWPHIRVARGDQLIRNAQALLAKNQPRAALLLLRIGLSHAPANRDGRILLAQLLTKAGRPELAHRLLLEGLSFHHDDPTYLQPLFSFLLQRQGDATVLGIARKYLPTKPTDSERDRVYSLNAATAAYFRGNYDQAEDFVRAQPGLEHSRDGRLLAAKIEWERDYRELALLRLRELATSFPDDLEIHREFVAHLEQAGNHEEVRRHALIFQIAHPSLSAPRLDLLRAYQLTGKTDLVARETEAFIRDFATDPIALLALADFAATSGNVPLARRLTELARERGSAWEPHAILTVEALVVARDFRDALDAARDLPRENSDWNARFGLVVSSLQAIAYFGLDDNDSGRLMLTRYLNQPHLRAENLLALAQRLVNVGAEENARQALVHAVTADPLNQAALTRLVELDLNLNRLDELPSHLNPLLTMRKPSPDVLRVAHYKLGSDPLFRSETHSRTLESVRLALEKTARTTPRF